MADEADERIGQVIAEKWRLERVLGRGAMAVVYEAVHRQGRRAALKVMHKDLVGDEGAEERFFAEARLANSVEHEGIARVFDDGHTSDKCPYLVMELLEGMTLEQLRVNRGGYVAPQEVLELAKRLLDVMVSMHEKQIVHRDLKPTNVFLTNDGQLKLLDFGLARSLLSGARAKSSVVGFVMGTPSFMSPEQALGKRDEVDAQSDVWSLGAIFFTMLTGQVVHQAPTPEGRLMAAASQHARSIKTVMPTLDPRIQTAIDRALSYDKKARFPTVRAMRDALFVTQQSIASAIADASKPQTPSQGRAPIAVAQPEIPHDLEPPAFGHASEPPAFGTESEPPPADPGSSQPPVDVGAPHALPHIALEPAVEREDAPPSVRHVSSAQIAASSSGRMVVAPPVAPTPGPMQPMQPMTPPPMTPQRAQQPHIPTPHSYPPHPGPDSARISQAQLQTQPYAPQAVAPAGGPAPLASVDVPIDMDPEPAVPIGRIETRPMAAPTMLVRERPPPRSGGRWWLVVMLVLFFVVAAGGAGFVYVRKIKLRR